MRNEGHAGDGANGLGGQNVAGVWPPAPRGSSFSGLPEPPPRVTPGLRRQFAHQPGVALLLVIELLLD